MNLNDYETTLQISTHPEFTIDKLNDTFEFKSLSNYNYLELTNEKRIFNDGVKKSIGVMLEISQLVEMIYDKTESIFSDNVRLFVSNPYVDNSIINTLIETPNIFHVLHNGIALVCNRFYFSCDALILEKTNIVNGAQTLFNIIKLIKFGIIDIEFFKNKFVFAKIIEIDSTQTDEMRLKISQAANTQKAINLQDLKSNHRYLINFKNLLSLYSIDLIIKRGTKSQFVESIKVDKFAKLVYAALYQEPGFARNASLKVFFDETDVYFKRTFQFEFDNDRNNKLRVFIIYLYFKYIENTELINKKLGDSQRYIELYYVSYIFGKVFLNKSTELHESIDNVTDLDLFTKFDKYILELTEEFAKKIKPEVKKLKKDKSLFNIFKSDDLYFNIFPESKLVRGKIESIHEINKKS